MDIMASYDDVWAAEGDTPSTYVDIPVGDCAPGLEAGLEAPEVDAALCAAAVKTGAACPGAVWSAAVAAPYAAVDEAGLLAAPWSDASLPAASFVGASCVALRRTGMATVAGLASGAGI